LHPAKSAGGPVGRKVGTTPPSLLPVPADRLREQEGGKAGAAIAKDITDFIAALDLGRIPQIDEHSRLATLVAAKFDSGWTAAELKNSIDGRWANANDRIAIVVSRLKKLPKQPQRRSARQAIAEPLAECAECQVAIKGALAPDGLCADCRTEANGGRPMPELLKSVPPKDLADAMAQARAEGLTDVRAQELRAVELLTDLYGTDAPKD
jgi:hypothetical protein